MRCWTACNGAAAVARRPFAVLSTTTPGFAAKLLTRAEAAGRERLLAGNVSTRSRHESDLRRPSSDGQGQLSAQPATWKSRPGADSGDGQFPGSSPRQRHAASSRKLITRTGHRRGRQPWVVGTRSVRNAALGLRPCGLTGSGASRASHRPAASAGGGGRTGPPRAPPPETDHAAAPCAAACRLKLEVGARGSRRNQTCRRTSKAKPGTFLECATLAHDVPRRRAMAVPQAPNASTEAAPQATCETYRARRSAGHRASAAPSANPRKPG